MRLPNYFSLLLATLLGAQSAHAAEIWADEEGFHLRGPIEAGDGERFKKMAIEQDLQQMPLRIHLDSPGGSVVDGVQIAEIVGELLLWVSVSENASCQSSCFLIIAGSPLRGESIPGRIGVHRLSLDEEAMKTADASSYQRKIQAASASIRDWLLEREVPEAIVTRMQETPPHQMHFLTMQEKLDVAMAALIYRDFIEKRCGKLTRELLNDPTHVACENKAHLDAAVSAQNRLRAVSLPRPTAPN
ncbi:hypothetical protein K3217_25820 [bacterium BD-1]|nr:hypothetical protein [Ottowia caeni]